MDIKDITITDEEIKDFLGQATPGEPASFKEDACAFYLKSKPIILTGILILSFVLPPAAEAISGLSKIVEKTCGIKE